jgi:IS1 family transposase
MNILKHEKKLAVLSALVEGNSIRSVVRMTGVHKTTILRLVADTGEECARLMDREMRNLRCREIEADELWCFVGKKQRLVTPEERAAGELGDQYTFIALDPITKLVPVFVVGKRDHANAFRFIRELRARVPGHIQLSTDGYKPYLEAVERYFGGNVDYAQIIKNYAPEEAGRGRYSPPAVVGVERIEVTGRPEPSRICTSYVERNNLTIRMCLRRFTRLTNGFSKKLANLKAMVALFLAYYNFCRVHGALRVTPAMAAGLTDRVWELSELMG